MKQSGKTSTACLFDAELAPEEASSQGKLPYQ
jgi:hypothetical protein